MLKVTLLRNVVHTCRVTEGGNRILQEIKKKGEKWAELESKGLIFHKDVRVLLREGELLALTTALLVMTPLLVFLLLFKGKVEEQLLQL